MKKITILYYIIIVSLFVGCESNDDVVDTTGGIVADFSFTSEGNLFQFTNLSQGATSYRWDLGDLSFYCDKENPSYRYTNIGGDIEVTLTAMNESGQENYVTKTITAPDYFDIEIEIDGDFSDWENVEFLYDQSVINPGVGSMERIKIWGGGENINVYIEGNTTMQMEIVDIFINSDGDDSSGFLSWQWPNSSGADYLFEGPLLSNSWGVFYKHRDPNGGWDWGDPLAGSGANMYSSGIVNVDADTNVVEFSIPKSQFDSLGSTISLAISELTIGWAGVAIFPEVTESSSFVSYELPIESTSFCE